VLFLVRFTFHQIFRALLLNLFSRPPEASGHPASEERLVEMKLLHLKPLARVVKHPRSLVLGQVQVLSDIQVGVFGTVVNKVSLFIFWDEEIYFVRQCDVLKLSFLFFCTTERWNATSKHRPKTAHPCILYSCFVLVVLTVSSDL